MKYTRSFLILTTLLAFIIFPTSAQTTTCYSESSFTKNIHIIDYISLEHSHSPKSLNIHEATSIVQPKGKYLILKSVGLDNGGRDLVVELWKNNTKERLLLSVPLKRYDKNYGGFSTLDYIDIDWEKNTPNNWPVISITQTSLPGKNDRDFSPGPPERRSYKYQIDSQCYQYANLHE